MSTGTPGGRPGPGDIDLLAVARGAGVALGVGVAAALAAHALDAVGEGGSPLALPLLLVVIAGLAAGGWVSARACLRAPLTHAGLAAGAAIAVLLLANVAGQLLDGDDVRWSYVVIWVPLAVASGLAGGLTALRRPRYRADSPDGLSRG